MDNTGDVLAELTEPPVPAEVKEVNMDKLFTFIGEKKTGSTRSRSSIA